MSAWGLVFIGLFLTACQYSFRGALPENVKTIHVGQFVDRQTGGRAIAAPFRNQVIQAFVDDNSLISVSKNQADLVLTGSIESVNRTTTKIQGGNQAVAEAYKVTVVVAIECRYRESRKTLVKTSIARDAQVSATVSESEIDTTIDQLLIDISTQIVDRVIGAW